MKNTNKDLGLKVHEYLLKHQVENPALFAHPLAQNSKLIEQKLAEILALLGVNMQHNAMLSTPQKVTEFLINDLFYGLDYANFPKITTNNNEYGYASEIAATQINFHSTCEHHLTAITGFATVKYIPNKKIIGFGNINKIVDFFAKRPQVQERVTRQIFLALQYILDTNNVSVTIEAQHHCISARGVRDTNTLNITHADGNALVI